MRSIHAEVFLITLLLMAGVVTACDGIVQALPSDAVQAQDAGDWTEVGQDAGLDAGGKDAGASADAGPDVDGGADAGAGADAGVDAGIPVDGGTDAGVDAGIDAGTPIDGGTDAGADAGTDAGTPVDGGTDAGVGADAGVDAGTSQPVVSPYPVYTQAEVDAWSTASPEYTRLAHSWAGNANRVYDVSYGTEIDSTERDQLKDESVYIKTEAVLWAADHQEARRDKVIARLDNLRSVTSWAWDSVEQYRLVAGWVSTNLAQAAAIVGYHDPQFTRFLVDVCYPIMDWTGSNNWQASFADSKLAIAVYTKDDALYQDAKAYFYSRLPWSTYDSVYDGDKVKPVLKADGTPDVSGTIRTWGGYWGAPQVNADFTFVDPSYVEDGFTSETIRDLGHVSMGLGAWMHAARTIRAHGDVLEREAYDRLRAGYALHAKRVLAYKNTGTIPAPTPVKGDGGGALNQGWFGAARLFGSDTPADVLTLCQHPDVTGYPAAGANHLVAEAFADGP